MRRVLVVFVALALLLAARHVFYEVRRPTGPLDGRSLIDGSAETYVRLALALGHHDVDWIDAYFGPPDWPLEVQAAALPLAAIRNAAALTRSDLARGADHAGQDDAFRRQYLEAQLIALEWRVSHLLSGPETFDRELRALAGMVLEPTEPIADTAVAARLAGSLPGHGPLSARVGAYLQRFIVPAARMEAVVRRALRECRDRTRAHVALPDAEFVDLQLGGTASAAGRQQYRGRFHSVIAVASSGVTVDQALDLACHEGYPGHHVQHVLLDEHLVRGRGWIEFSVVPLLSPAGFVGEVLASQSVDRVFPPEERATFLRDVLFPMAGFESAEVDGLLTVRAATRRLAGNVPAIAREYLDGRLDRTRAMGALADRAFVTAPAETLGFIERYRSFVVAYAQTSVATPRGPS